MKKFVVIVGLLIVSTNVYSQSAEDSVKAVVNKMFTAMKSAD